MSCGKLPAEAAASARHAAKHKTPMERKPPPWWPGSVTPVSAVPAWAMSPPRPWAVPAGGRVCRDPDAVWRSGHPPARDSAEHPAGSTPASLAPRTRVTAGQGRGREWEDVELRQASLRLANRGRGGAELRGASPPLGLGGGRRSWGALLGARSSQAAGRHRSRPGDGDPCCTARDDPHPPPPHPPHTHIYEPKVSTKPRPNGTGLESRSHTVCPRRTRAGTCRPALGQL